MTANDATEDGIIDAYFAKKVWKETGCDVSENSPYEYRFKHPQNFQNKTKLTVATEIRDLIKAELNGRQEFADVSTILSVLTADSYAKDDPVSFEIYKMQEGFEKIDSSALESDVYVFAKTGNLDGKEITILIQEKEEFLVGANAPLPILERDDTSTEVQKSEDLEEITELKATIDEGMVKIPIRLRPKGDDTLKEWQDKIAKGKEDGTYTYTFNNAAGTTITDENKEELAGIIAVNANEGKLGNTKVESGKKAYADDVVSVLAVQTYNKGDQITFPIFKKLTEFLWLKASAQGDEELHEKEFLNESDTSYFKIGNNCSCNRNLTSEEITKIINDLRKEENLAEDILFDKPNCNLPTNDKTIERFTEEFNTVCSEYEINSCIRKVHFISQIYHETDRFRTTKEYNEEASYKPYIGRGLMQLTWEDGYKRYGSYINEDLITNYETVSTDLFKAFDSAGWFWKKGKKLSSKTTWSPPSGAPSYVKQGISYPVTSYDYTFNAQSLSYNSIDLNEIADDDYGDVISWLVNGGNNGLQERRDYLALLKKMQIFICTERECPEDRSQCFNYADVWENPEISSDNGGKNNNRYLHGSTRGHKGIDIITGETYKTVHSLMCGEVVSLVDSFATNEYKRSSLGNTLMIKSKAKNGDEVFILYCHLDSISVEVGNKVEHGEAVAVSGSTGNAAEILNDDGSLKNGIRKANWHVHIEAATKGDGYNNFYSLGSYRVQPEDYMKTKFDSDGNTID